MTPNRPLLIGLTGGIACGKSHLSATLKGLGAVVIDADEISRGLTAPGGRALPLIRERFGDAVFDGTALDRQALARQVFGVAENLIALNSLMHPLVFEEMEQQMARYQQEGALVLDVPLLYETGYNQRCRQVWCAWVPERIQLERLMKRGLTREEALERVRSQMPAMDKAKWADHVIITTSTKEDSARNVTRLWEALKRKGFHV